LTTVCKFTCVVMSTTGGCTGVPAGRIGVLKVPVFADCPRHSNKPRKSKTTMGMAGAKRLKNWGTLPPPRCATWLGFRFCNSCRWHCISIRPVLAAKTLGLGLPPRQRYKTSPRTREGTDLTGESQVPISLSAVSEARLDGRMMCARAAPARFRYSDLNEAARRRTRALEESESCKTLRHRIRRELPLVEQRGLIFADVSRA
jgi:hypothetical protein